MTNVSFQEEQFSRRGGAPKHGLTGLVVSLGLAKTEKGANMFLTALLIICAAAAAYVFTMSDSSSANQAELRAQADHLQQEGQVQIQTQ